MCVVEMGRCFPCLFIESEQGINHPGTAGFAQTHRYLVSWPCKVDWLMEDMIGPEDFPEFGGFDQDTLENSPEFHWNYFWEM